MKLFKSLKKKLKRQSRKGFWPLISWSIQKILSEFGKINNHHGAYLLYVLFGSFHYGILVTLIAWFSLRCVSSVYYFFPVLPCKINKRLHIFWYFFNFVDQNDKWNEISICIWFINEAWNKKKMCEGESYVFMHHGWHV